MGDYYDPQVEERGKPPKNYFVIAFKSRKTEKRAMDVLYPRFRHNSQPSGHGTIIFVDIYTGVEAVNLLLRHKITAWECSYAGEY
jgi:hypothetical protein